MAHPVRAPGDGLDEPELARASDKRCDERIQVMVAVPHA